MRFLQVLFAYYVYDAMCQKEASRFDINTKRLAGKASRKRPRVVLLKVRPEQEVEINHCLTDTNYRFQEKQRRKKRKWKRKEVTEAITKPPPPKQLLLQDVGCIQRAQGPGEDQPGHHRLVNIQTSLLGVGELSVSLLPYCDNSTVCGQPHRLCSYQRHSGGCVEHILLDSLHIHNPKCLLEADRDRCGTPRNRQNYRSRRAEICQILPMGVLLPILPGKERHYY